MPEKEYKKIFLIFAPYHIGDILLINPLLENIKRLYPESVSVVLCQEKFKELLLFQKNIDKIIFWERDKEHKNIFNTLKFVHNFPYKKIYAAFPVFGSDRAILLSKLLKSKYILFHNYKKGLFKLFRKSKYPIIINDKSVQEINLNLLSGITQEKLINTDIQFFPPDISP